MRHLTGRQRHVTDSFLQIHSH
jgi:hypothetical protein